MIMIDIAVPEIMFGITIVFRAIFHPTSFLDSVRASTTVNGICKNIPIADHEREFLKISEKYGYRVNM